MTLEIQALAWESHKNVAGLFTYVFTHLKWCRVPVVQSLVFCIVFKVSLCVFLSFV